MGGKVNQTIQRVVIWTTIQVCGLTASLAAMTWVVAGMAAPYEILLDGVDGPRLYVRTLAAVMGLACGITGLVVSLFANWLYRRWNVDLRGLK
jgi:hypothetical protein